VLRVARAGDPPAKVVVGGVYWLFVFLQRLLPYRLVETLLYKMYMPR
jgi:hypothetical protein